MSLKRQAVQNPQLGVLQFAPLPALDLRQAAPTVDFGTSSPKAEVFGEIYQKNVWPGMVSKSGPGSDPFHPMVRLAISALDAVVDAFHITSMMDAACGDAGWITSHFLNRRPELQYTGVDIVEHVIRDNRRRYPTLPFLCVDLGDPSADVHGSLPKVDLVFSKETINHMFIQDAVRALRRLSTTDARFLLTHITRCAPNNLGAKKGHHANFAQYDYALPPFNLEKLATILEINQDDWSEWALFRLQPS